MKIAEKVEAITDAALRSMRPDEIDGMLAELDYTRVGLLMEQERILTRVHNGVRDVYSSKTGWRMSHEDALVKAREKGVRAAADYDRNAGSRARVASASDRLNNEYDRRGGWSRAWLVTNGHAHRSRHCSTCNNGERPTEFDWQPKLSGMTEEQMIDAMSNRACTVCYPDAPVAKGLKVPVSKLSTREERARAAAREEAAQKQAEKAAKAAAGAITHPDGTPLRREVDRDGRQRGSVVKTTQTARSDLKRECWYQYAWGDGHGNHERNIQHLARAIAWREAGLPVGQDPTREQIDAVIAPLRAKAIKEVDKARKEGR